MLFFLPEDRLLFQGDSITHGNRIESDWDQNHLLGHGYQFTLAGRIALDNPDRCPQILNRGVSGDTVQRLLARWERDTLALAPTVLSLLVGVNDCMQGAADRYGENLDRLLRRTRDALPQTVLIVCEPFGFASPDGGAPAGFLDGIVRCAAEARRLAEKYNAVFVPFFQALSPYVRRCPPGYIIWDGVHPTYAGHAVLARCWYAAVDAAGIFTDRRERP